MKQNQLKSKIKQIFIKHGLSNNHAEIASNYLVKAELIEAKSHGLARLKMYCDRIRSKLIKAKPKIKPDTTEYNPNFFDIFLLNIP